MFNQLNKIKRHINILDEIIRDMDEEANLFKGEDINDLRTKVLADKEKWLFLYKRQIILMVGLAGFVIISALMLASVLVGVPIFVMIGSLAGLTISSVIREFFKDKPPVSRLYLLLAIIYTILLAASFAGEFL